MTNPAFHSSVTKKNGSSIISLSYIPSKKGEKSLTIQIAPGLGSNMFAMQYGVHNIIYHDPSLLKICGFTGNFVLFPTPNRIKKFLYRWNKKNIPTKKRGKIVKIHGLVF